MVRSARGDDRRRVPRTAGRTHHRWRSNPAGRLVGDVRAARRDGDDHRRARFDRRASSTTCSVTSPPSSPPTDAAYRNEFDEIGRLIAAIDPTGRTLGDGLRRRRQAGRVHRSRRPRRCAVTSTCSAAPIESIAADGAVTALDLSPERRDRDRHRSRRPHVVDRDRRSPVGSSPSSTRRVAGPPARTAPRGRLLSRTSPAGRTERFEYDVAGRCIAVVGVDGIRRELTLDERGQITGIDTSVADGVADPAPTRPRATISTSSGTITDASSATEPPAVRLQRRTGRGRAHPGDHRCHRRHDPLRVGRARSARARPPIAAGVTSAYSLRRARPPRRARPCPGDHSTRWGYDLAGVRRRPSPTRSTSSRPSSATAAASSPAFVAAATAGIAPSTPAGREDRAARPRRHGAGPLRLRHRRSPDLGGGPRDRAITRVPVGRQRPHHRSSPTRPARAPSSATPTVGPLPFTNQHGVRTVVERDTLGRVVGLRDGEAGEYRAVDAEFIRDPAGRLLIGPDGNGVPLRRRRPSRRDRAARRGRPRVRRTATDGLVSREVGPNGTA